MIGQRTPDLLEPSWRKRFVRIHVNHEVAGCGSPTPVAGKNTAAPCFEDHVNVDRRVLADKLRDESRGLVCRGVVRDDDLVWRRVLRDQRVQAGYDELFLIEGWNHDAERGMRCCWVAG